MQYEYVLNVASVFALYLLYEYNRSHAPTHVVTRIRYTLVWSVIGRALRFIQSDN
jgi:hypothetical protein